VAVGVFCARGGEANGENRENCLYLREGIRMHVDVLIHVFTVCYLLSLCLGVCVMIVGGV